MESSTNIESIAQVEKPETIGFRQSLNDLVERIKKKFFRR